MAVTLTNLTDRAKQMADLVGSDFVSSTEWTTWINAGLLELYDVIIGAYEDYFTIYYPGDMTIASGDSTFTVPTDFYKLRGIDYKISDNKYLPLDQYNFRDRGRQLRWDTTQSQYGTVRKYRMVKDTIYITPDDKAEGTYRFWYIPALTPLSSGSDTIPTTMSKFGWEQYIVYYATIQAKTKGEEDLTEVLRLKDELSARITSMVANRNADQPETITDVKGRPVQRWDGLDW